MNATAASGVARAAGIVLILVLAAAAGLAVGNLIQQVNGDRSLTAEPRRSLEGLAALQQAASDDQAYVDYGVRHAPAAAVFQDYGVRHPIAAAPALVWQDYGIRHLAAAAASASNAASTSDTFRLTGPSDVDEAAPTSDTFRLTGPSDVDQDFLRSRAN